MRPRSFLASVLTLTLMFSSLWVTPFGPEAKAAVISSSSTSTSIGPCQVALCNSPNPQNATFNPATIPNYFGQDLGQFAVKTAPSGFTWAVNMTTDFMKMGIPTVGGSTVPNSLVYYNSSHTAYQLSGSFGSLSVFFKQTQYRVKISIHANLLSGQTVCLPFTSPNPIVQPKAKNGTSDASIRTGNEVFDWHDINSTLFPNSFVSPSLCISLPTGTTNIDPLALDGSGINSTGAGTSVGCAFTTTTTNDVLVVETNTFSQAPSGISSSPSLTWTQRVQVNQAGATYLTEWSAVWASSGAITATVTTGSSTFITVICFGVSGANTGSIWDPNGGLPASAKATSNPNANQAVTFSTSNANDFLIVFAGDDNNDIQSPTADSGFTIIQHGASASEVALANEYKVVSATQTNLVVNLKPGGSSSAFNWVIIADGIQQAANTVTQPIKITTANSAPSATITISGCGTLTNSTFTANGNVKHYSGVTASATCSLTEPADGTNTRYRWNVSPHPTAATVISFVACASGTCSEYDNNTYYQIQQTYSMTPLTPSAWDSTYLEPLTGTQLGASVTITTFHLFPGGGAASGSFYADYNLVVTFVSSFVSAINASYKWIGLGPITFTQTTGGNTDNVNYVLTLTDLDRGSSDSTPWVAAVIVLLFIAASLGMLSIKRSETVRR
jgi:hypothetical protein